MSVTARHLRRGTAKCHWVTTIASKGAPTVAEINAGTELTEYISAVNDWTMERTLVQLPTVDSYGFMLSTEAPRQMPNAPSIVMYHEDNDSTRTTLAEGSKGFIVFTLEGAPVAADTCDVWPVISLGPQDRMNYELEPATWQVLFSLWDLPEEGVAIA